LLQGYHRRFGFGQQIQENELDNYKSLNLRAEQIETYSQNIIPLLFPKSRGFLFKVVVSELVKIFPTISGTTNYAYPQNVIAPLMLMTRESLEKQYIYFFISYFVYVLTSTNRGCWLFVHFNISVFCLFL
jgi:hypothetical protein